MKKILITACLMIATQAISQTGKLNIKNALVVGQLDKGEDRYTLEVNLTELLTQQGIKAIPSLNMMKMGSDAVLLATDSIQQLVKSKGVDTYVLVTIRGYDKRFKPSVCKDDLPSALSIGNLFPMYRDEAVSVSFEFIFYRNGQCIGTDIVKCGNVADRDSVIKKFRKVMARRIQNKWI
jgi:hypothetical protein